MVVVVALLTMIAGYVRNWALIRIDDSGSLAGIFAAIMVFIAFVQDVGLLGGSTASIRVFSSEMSRNSRLRVISAYYIASLLWMMSLFLVSRYSETLEIYVVGNLTQYSGLLFLYVIGSIAMLHVIMMSNLHGTMRYKTAALLGSSFPILVSIVSVLLLYSFRVSESEYLLIVFSLMIAVYLIQNAMSGIIIFRKENEDARSKKQKFQLTDVIILHLMSICSFTYLNIDKVIVLKFLGVGQLGLYYVVLRISQFVSLLPNRLGSQMLSYFTRMTESAQHIEKVRVNRCVVTVVTALAFMISILLIAYSREVLGVFGQSMIDYYGWLCLLTISSYASATKNVHGLNLLSEKKDVRSLLISLSTMAIQIGLYYLLAPIYGIEGVIAAHLIVSYIVVVVNIVAMYGMSSTAFRYIYEHGVVIILLFILALYVTAGSIGSYTYAVIPAMLIVFYVLHHKEVKEATHMIREALQDRI